jgi:hypothetical protein
VYRRPNILNLLLQNGMAPVKFPVPLLYCNMKASSDLPIFFSKLLWVEDLPEKKFEIYLQYKIYIWMKNKLDDIKIHKFNVIASFEGMP